MEVLERERLRNQGGGSGGLSVTSGNGNDMIGGNGGPGGMGKKSSSTSQLSAAGNDVDCLKRQSKPGEKCSLTYRRLMAEKKSTS